LLAELVRLRNVIDTQIFTETDLEIWRQVHHADALLLEHLVNGELESEGDTNAVLAAYDAVFDAGATQREVSSVTGQIQFIIDELSHPNTTHLNSEKIVSVLTKIRDSISRKQGG
jgi:hypothetical protein